jgi:predicted kinase
MFKDTIKEATKFMDSELSKAISEGKNVIWDQTNLSKKKRASILSKFPKEYEKVCIVLKHPDSASEFSEWDKRLAHRAEHTGKYIPIHVINSMHSSYEKPSYEEGFDKIVHYNSFE